MISKTAIIFFLASAVRLVVADEEVSAAFLVRAEVNEGFTTAQKVRTAYIIRTQFSRRFPLSSIAQMQSILWSRTTSTVVLP